MWSRCATAANEVQGLEARCLLSADPLTGQPALITIDVNSLSSLFEAGLIQINAIRMHDFSGLSPAADGQLVYGPIFPATASLPGPTEDLYDEGAGAVWGSLSDEGTEPAGGSPQFGEADGDGAMAMNDMPWPDIGGYDTLGVNDGPLPDMGDFPTDQGYDLSATDSGFDDLGGVLGYDDGGYDVWGADIGTGTGAADGSAGPQINIQVPDAEAWEGPYRVSKLDEAKFVLNVTGGIPGLAVNVTVSFTGTATPGIDYRAIDSSGQPVKFMAATEGGVTTANVHGGVGAADTWFKIIALMDVDYELPETVIVTIVAGFGYEIGDLDTATAVIDDMTGDLDIDGLNEDTEDDPGAKIQRNDDDDNDNQIPDYLDAPINILDDDLVPLVATSHLKRPNDYAPAYRLANDLLIPTKAWFVLAFDSSEVRVFETDGDEVISGVTQISDSDGATSSLFVEGVGSGVGSIAFVWTAVVDDPGGNMDGQEVFRSTFDTVKYTVWGLDLDIYKVQVDSNGVVTQGTVPDAAEFTKGGYLPVNSDDDNYDQEEDIQGAGNFGSHENDLLPLFIELADDSPHFRLKFESSKLRLWTHLSGGTQIVQSEELDPLNLPDFERVWGGIRIWAEGVDETGTRGANVTLQAKPAAEWMDVTNGKIRLRTFTMAGAANVPGLTSYEYEAKNGSSTNSKWLSATPGTTSPNVQNGSFDRVTVGWEAGPQRGFVQYQAAPDFVWAYDVNVVAVTSSNLSLNNTTSNVHAGPLCSSIPGTYVISGDPAIRATAHVQIKGPLIDGVYRGQRFVAAGFMQVTTSRQTNITASAVMPMSGPDIRVVHESQGDDTLLDIWNRSLNPDCGWQDEDVDLPWYDGRAGDANGVRKGQFFEGSSAADDQAPLERDWEITDRPAFSLPDAQDFWVNVNDVDTKYRWNTFNLHWNFQTLIGVATLDPHRLESDLQKGPYFARARGDWSFDGSGTNNAGTWTAQPGQTNVTVGAFQETGDSERITWNTRPNVAYFNHLLGYGFLVGDPQNTTHLIVNLAHNRIVSQ